MLSLIPLGPKLRLGPQIREAPLRLCGDGSSDTGGLEAELRGSAFPSRESVNFLGHEFSCRRKSLFDGRSIDDK